MLCVQFSSSWWWAEKPPGTCRAQAINTNIRERCILLVYLKEWCDWVCTACIKIDTWHVAGCIIIIRLIWCSLHSMYDKWLNTSCIIHVTTNTLQVVSHNKYERIHVPCVSIKLKWYNLYWKYKNQSGSSKFFGYSRK